MDSSQSTSDPKLLPVQEGTYLLWTGSGSFFVVSLGNVAPGGGTSSLKQPSVPLCGFQEGTPWKNGTSDFRSLSVGLFQTSNARDKAERLAGVAALFHRALTSSFQSFGANLRRDSTINTHECLM